MIHPMLSAVTVCPLDHQTYLPFASRRFLHWVAIETRTKTRGAAFPDPPFTFPDNLHENIARVRSFEALTRTESRRGCLPANHPVPKRRTS